MRTIAVVVLALAVTFGSADAFAQAKKTATSAQTKKAAPAKKSTAKTPSKKTVKKKTTAKPAPAVQEKTAVETPATPAPAEPAKADTASNPSLKDYAKSKVNEAGAAKDTLLKSGADKVGAAKENLSKKIRDFDPFRKSKADTAKTK